MLWLAIAVAVMPVNDLSGTKGSAGEAIRETVTADRREVAGVKGLERDRIDQLIAAQTLAAKKTDLDAVASGRLGTLVGATMIVAGAYQRAGKTVRLTHGNGVESTYGHLSSIAPAVVVGERVERGQVIGYVGSTGLSTGPHLHYELTRVGAHVDPLEFNCEREPSIGAVLVKQFDRAKREVVRQLASIPATRQPTSLSLSTTLLQAE